MTRWNDICDRCGATVVPDENWGATLCDDWVGLERHDDVHLCEDCRDDLEDWLEKTPDKGANHN